MAATGTWVAVGAVRAKPVDAMGGRVRDAVITGENEAELGALLLLSNTAQQMDTAELRAALTEKLSASAKAATGSKTRVCRAIILTRDPSFDRGEVTEMGSLNQRTMRANHADVIAELYAGGPEVFAV